MDWVKPLIALVRDFLAGVLGFVVGRKSVQGEQKEAIIEQAKVGKEVREEINNLTPDELKRLRDKYTR